MIRVTLQMARRIITLVHIICVLLTIHGTLSIESPSSNPVVDSDASLSTLLELIPSVRDAVLQKDYVSSACPQLWDKEREFNGTAGYFGSLEEIDTFCREKPSTICTLAVWMSSYLCNATQGLRSGNDAPKPPKMPDFQKLNNTDYVCAALGSDDLSSDISAAVAKNGNTQIQSLSAFFPMVQASLIKMCPTTCKEKNLRTCQVVLQGLRTVVAWEELKRKQLTSPNNEASPTESAGTTRPAATTRTTAFVNDTNVPSLRVETMSNASSNVAKEQVTTLSKTTAAVTTPTSTTTTILLDNMSEEEEAVPPMENPAEAETDGETPRNELDGDSYDEDDAEKGMEETSDTDKKLDTVHNNEPPKITNEQKDYSIDEPEDTHFIIYFLVCLGLIVAGYVLYHRRNRVVALIVEGRSGSQRRRGTTGSRGSSASYKRLDNNLEEVVTSSRPVRSSNVIY